MTLEQAKLRLSKKTYVHSLNCLLIRVDGIRLLSYGVHKKSRLYT